MRVGPGDGSGLSEFPGVGAGIVVADGEVVTERGTVAPSLHAARVRLADTTVRAPMRHQLNRAGQRIGYRDERLLPGTVRSLSLPVTPGARGGPLCCPRRSFMLCWGQSSIRFFR